MFSLSLSFWFFLSNHLPFDRLLYTALFILSFLAIFDVMQGEWPGYLVMKPRSATDAPAVSSTPANTGVPGEPKYETGHELTA